MRGFISIHPPRMGWDAMCIVSGAFGGNFQSTHPVWGGTEDYTSADGTTSISIHPPRMGWDCSTRDRKVSVKLISIHPPRMGWDHVTVMDLQPSTHFNPPTPYGVGPKTDTNTPQQKRFQSTHPVWGGTTTAGVERDPTVFQSTHPVWGGTSRIFLSTSNV